MNTPTTATVLGLHVAGLALAALLGSPPAQADTVAYLVNVTVRPGYNFRSADDAIATGADYARASVPVKAMPKS